MMSQHREEPTIAINEMHLIRGASAWTVAVPAGTYFLGDPGYAVPAADWMPLLESCGGHFGAGPPIGQVAGYQVVAFTTNYGDGEFWDQYGHFYGVDAGLIGLVPSAANWKRPMKELRRLGRIVQFKKPTLATTDDEGRTQFGKYRIDTTLVPPYADL